MWSRLRRSSLTWSPVVLVTSILTLAVVSHAKTQSVFCVAPRRDGAGVRPTDHRRDGRQKTGWTKPQRYPSMGIRSSEAGRGQVSWPGGGPGVGGRSRRGGVGGPPAPVWWMQRAHAS